MEKIIQMHAAAQMLKACGALYLAEMIEKDIVNTLISLEVVCDWKN